MELIDGGLTIKHTEVKSITGDAEINVRKGKQALIYDFTIEVEWTATTVEDVAEGTYKVSDLNPFDDDFEIDHVKVNEKSTISQRAQNLIKKSMKDLWIR